MIDQFLSHQRLRGFSPKTIERRQWSLGKFASSVAPRTIDTASTADVEVWLAHYHDPQTIYSLLSDLRQFYRWALRRELVDVDPTAVIDSPRLPKRAPTPLHPDDLRRLLAAAGGATRVMVLLAVYAGLRVSEIADLAGSEIRPDSLYVRGGKGRKDRSVPLAPVLQVALDGAPRGPLFPDLLGRHISRRIKRLMIALEIDARPHDLRHTFGTEAARVANGNLVVVAQLMGHASINTTMQYVGWTADGAEVVAHLFGDAA